MTNIWIAFLSSMAPPPPIWFILFWEDGPESAGCHPVLEEGGPEGQLRSMVG